MITAPQSGTVAVMSGELGQMMSKQTILTVLPENSTLEAQLFVPGSAVGFIKLGDKLGLRITAYPYLKFGKVDGTVTELSQTSISAQEMPSQLSAAKQSALNGNGEAMFRVKIALSKQTISVYGTHKPMLSGMDVETEIVQERRSLLGWVLEPLYRFKENL
jgi:membrane fusion protein